MLRIGTSGFSYADWRGVFYPRNLESKEFFSYYSRFFSTIEINTSYYKLPEPAFIKHLLKHAPPGFDFVFKAPKEFTHERHKFQDSCPVFIERLRPIFERGILGTVLLQFPYSFKYTPINMDYLKTMRDCMPYPVHAEFRSSDWVNERVLQALSEYEIGFVNVDEPNLPDLMPKTNNATTPIGYYRFHGRNSKSWWEHGTAAERYNYLYSEEELREWVDEIRASGEKQKKVYIFMNNHYQAKAVKNAVELSKMLGVARETPIFHEEKDKSLLDF